MWAAGSWLVLARLIHLIGLVVPSKINMRDNALATDKRSARDNKMPIAWHFSRVIGARFPAIHFVGVWDTVASVLVPRSDRMWIPSLETLPYTRNNPSVRIFRSEELTSELQSLMRSSYAVFCLKKKKTQE